MKFLSFALTIYLSLWVSSQLPAAQLPPADAKNYGFAYWLNGLRKQSNANSQDILCFETGYFGMALDVNNLPHARLGPISPAPGYAEALVQRRQLLQELPPATLAFEITHDGTTYRAKRCVVGKPDQHRRLDNILMWESGQVVQHYELRNLVFEATDGATLACDASLFILVWPNSLTLRAEVRAMQDDTDRSHNWRDASMQIRLSTANQTWKKTLPIAETGSPESNHKIALHCNMSVPPERNTSVTVRIPNGQTMHAAFDDDYYCYKAEIKHLKRNWKQGYTDIRNYDEFTITISHSQAESTYLPFLLYLRKPANITGLCPIICDAEGHPTGIPVQLSKNWHDEKLGAYLRAYTLLPVAQGQNTYTLRITYGFYGSLPAASHAQLSLVGYGGHGRWDQLAIGCWGETICFDMDMSCVDVAITDSRMLMCRKGLTGRKWRWTDAGWGGDWLNLKDRQGKKLLFSEMKSAYLSHGPCLTEVRHKGFYGSERQVSIQNTIRTLRTDDYARTFQTLRYDFNETVSAANGWLFKMGRTNKYITPSIAYGDRNGLSQEHAIPHNLNRGSTYIAPFTMVGEAPYWIAFPGSRHIPTWQHASGSRALIIRSYRAWIQGKEYTRPTISFPVYQVHKNGLPNLDLLVTPPESVKQFQPGDRIEFEVEWVTLHRYADDYYGPNKHYLQHLQEHSCSWETTYREAIGNDLQIQIEGGVLLHEYPIIIKAEAPEVKVHIVGGVGAVPVRFEGLHSPSYRLYRELDGKLLELDQAIHGNDYWQTDYDTATGNYRLSFNVPLDGIDSSNWTLKAPPNR